VTAYRVFDFLFLITFSWPHVIGPSIRLFIGDQAGGEEIRPPLLFSCSLVVPVIADDFSRALLDRSFDAKRANSEVAVTEALRAVGRSRDEEAKRRNTPQASYSPARCRPS
jgi:hypothetical protein